MERDRLSRKLAVILHADVVGSTTLVQLDESVAHERIQAAFHAFSEMIRKYGGVAHEIRGDAIVAEFERASDAVIAAIAFQAVNEESNSKIDDEIRPQLRVGISLGEVVVADNTITGAGVVLAQRLEQLANPGSVVVQGAVSETVPVRLPIQFDSIGEHKLKGINQLVRAFTARIKAGVPVPAPEGDARPATGKSQNNNEIRVNLEAKSSRPSIAVLPFENMSGDEEQQYFSDGITEDIITELSRFRDLFVIARHSSFAFKDQKLDVAEIGKRLDVQYVVEGSVRKSANQVRITAQLIEIASGSQIWAERYDRELKDIFKVQDEVVRTITATLFGKVGIAYREVAQKKPPTSMDAYDWFVQGRELYSTTTLDENAEAISIFRKALTIDPVFAPAYALLSQACLRDWITFWTISPEESYENVWSNAKQSIALDDSDSVTHSAMGYAHLFKGNHDQAHFHLSRALELNPGDTDALIFMSRYEMLTGNPGRCIERINDANRYNPYGRYNWSLATAYYVMGNYAEAISKLRAIHSPAPIMIVSLAAACSQAGDVTEAKALAQKFVEFAERQFSSNEAEQPESWIEFMAQRWPFRSRTDMDHLLEGLRKAGLP